MAALAGLSAATVHCRDGRDRRSFSIVPVKRSHSVCAQGGINAAKNLKGGGDLPWIHFDDTVYGGDFLANQPPVKDMCEAAPGIIDLLDIMGVAFNRTPEGFHVADFRRFGGTLYNRTAFAGAANRTAAFLRARRAGSTLRSRRQSKESTSTGNFFRPCSTGTAVSCGVCAMDLRSMEVRTFPRGCDHHRDRR